MLFVPAVFFVLLLGARMPLLSQLEPLTFNQLSIKAQQAAVSRYRDTPVDGEWWDSVYEDAKRMGLCLGIEITDIHFTGFWNQGDGASYVGSIELRPGILEAVQTEAPQDEYLHDIARALTALRIQLRLRCGVTVRGEISRSRKAHYFHSGTMHLSSVDFYPLGQEVAVSNSECEEFRAPLEKYTQRFADWIYYELRQEYEYLTSDEAVRDRLSAYRFSSDGHII